MNPSVLFDRIASSGATDPDSLHGLLCLCEGREAPETLAPRLNRPASKVSRLLELARAGDMGRVPAADQTRDNEDTERPGGVLPFRWKREIVALMLCPDGTTIPEIDMVVIGAGYQSSPSHVLHRIQNDLMALGVTVERHVHNANGRSSYRIEGRSACRMQEIIENGWAL